MTLPQSRAGHVRAAGGRAELGYSAVDEVYVVEEWEGVGGQPLVVIEAGRQVDEHL